MTKIIYTNFFSFIIITYLLNSCTGALKEDQKEINIDYIKDGPEGEYLTDRLTTEAIQFVRENTDSSFFLYLPFYSVHTPIMGRPDLVEKFKNKKGIDGHDNPEYAAMIASVDMNIGRLLDELEQQGLKQNTIIFFTSDNGGIRDISYQDPLRAGKGSYYEGGIRVPLIINWPVLHLLLPPMEYLICLLCLAKMKSKESTHTYIGNSMKTKVLFRPSGWKIGKAYPNIRNHLNCMILNLMREKQTI